MQNLQHILLLWTIFTATLGISQEWQYKSPMPLARKGMAVAVLDQKIWVIGGSQTGNSGLDVVEVYNPLTDSWDTNYPSIQVAREDAVAQALSGKIYLFGGSDQMELISDVECYDPVIGYWEVVTEIPTPRRGLTSVIVDSAIWLIGGSNLQNNFYNLTEIYYPEMNSWDTLAAVLNYARSDAMATAKQFDIFVFGGNFFGPLARVEQYNPLYQHWETIESMLYNCGSAGCTTYENQSWIIGGIGLSGNPLELVQVFIQDSLQMKWQEGPPLNTPRRELVAATVNDRLYAIGGRGTMGHSYYDSVEELDLLVNIVEPRKRLPANYAILNNYPNPFNSTTTIQCSLPQRDEVCLLLLTVLGQELFTIYEGELVAGYHTFNLSSMDFSGNDRGSGLYFIQLRGKKFTMTHKIFLMK